MSVSGRLCTACNSPIPQDALFCASCGSPSPPEFDPRSTPTTWAYLNRAAAAEDRHALLQRALGSGFELRQLIGQGGFGEVWEAWDLRLKREVAVKVLLGDLAVSPALQARFAREAEAAAKLRHPNIIPI